MSFAGAIALTWAYGCGGSSTSGLTGTGGTAGSSPTGGAAGIGGAPGGGGMGSAPPMGGGGLSGGGGAAGLGGTAGAGGSGGATNTAIPTTCTQAAQMKTSFGCEFWPTVTPNQVWAVFDFAVIVMNPNAAPADVTVTDGPVTLTSVQIPASTAQVIYLPWESTLKGGEVDSCGVVLASTGSLSAVTGALRLSSTLPVSVSQHSPIEYEATGGPAGKSWSSCPGNQTCQSSGSAIGCYSFSSDSSLLLPTTSLGKVYRATGYVGLEPANVGPYLAVTATEPATTVTVKVGPKGAILGGSGLTAKNAGDSFDLILGRGDVYVLQAPGTAELGGTLLSADKPIQVIDGSSCSQVPAGKQACDHLEETVVPADSLGKHYLVPVPKGPKGDYPGHVVKLFGHVDGTKLVYAGSTPSGAPTTLAAGQSVDLGQVSQDFEVTGDQPFAVASYIPGGELLDPGTTSEAVGDPSARVVPAVEQFRTAYVVAAAPSYVKSFIEIVFPTGANVTVDAATITATPKALGASGYSVASVPADHTSTVLHRIEADQPIGVQVVGFGKYTSYAHPGGLSVKSLP